MGIWGAAELFWGFGEHKQNTFRELRQKLTGIWGDQSIIFRELGSKDPPWGGHSSRGIVLSILYSENKRADQLRGDSAADLCLWFCIYHAKSGFSHEAAHICKILAVYIFERVMRKPTFCICENKDADQLHGNREADQRLCFRYTDSTIHLLPKSEISSLFDCTAWFVSDLVGNPEDQFSHNEAHLSTMFRYPLVNNK